MDLKNKIIDFAVDNFGISKLQAVELIQKQFSSDFTKSKLAEKIFIEMISNRDSTDDLDIDGECMNNNNQLLAKYSLNLASVFEKESAKWKK